VKSKAAITELNQVVTLPKLDLRISDAPFLVFASEPTGSVLISRSIALLDLSADEFIAGIALEIAHLKLYELHREAAFTPMLGGTGISTRSEIAIGPWSHKVRIEAVRLASRYLVALGKSPVALLTFLESQHYKIQTLERDAVEGWIGGKLSEIVSEARRVAAESGVRIARSEVSPTYRFTTITLPSGVMFKIFGREGFRLNLENSSCGPDITKSLNEQFDKGINPWDIRALDSKLLIHGRVIHEFRGEQAPALARDVAKNLKFIASEYLKRTNVPE
jgi:hypothetical protein